MVHVIRNIEDGVLRVKVRGSITLSCSHETVK